MSECFYCEDGEKRKSLMIEICKLNYSTIYLNRNQKYPGRCVVKLNEHKTEYFQMTKEQRDGYFEELMQHLGIWYLMYMYMLFLNIKMVQIGVIHLMIHRERKN